MYFEDIYDKIRPYWKDSFSLNGIENTQTYVLSLKENYNQIDDLINSENFTWWEFSLAFTMYQALTAHAIHRWKLNRGVEEIQFSEIPITVFEEYYRRNLEPEDECEGSPEYLKQYQGLKEST